MQTNIKIKLIRVKKKNTKILKEECQGDFCDFISLDSMKLAELSSGHNVAQYFQNNEKKFTSSTHSFISVLI